MTVSVVDEALRALDRVRQQLAQERAVNAELLAALRDLCDAIPDETLVDDPPLQCWVDAALAAIQSAEGRRP